MKEEFSVKLQVENLLLLKIKIKQNPECPNKEYIIQSLSTFIRISGLNLEVKKSCIDQWLEKYCILRRTPAIRSVGKYFRIVPNKVESFGGEPKPTGKLCSYFRHLSVETLFSALKTDTKLLYKYEHFFYLKTGNLIKILVSLSLRQTVPERLSSQSSKIWSQVDFKNPNFPTLFWIENNFEVQPKTNIQKITIFNPWMNRENFCPNLSFTVENKIVYF